MGMTPRRGAWVAVALLVALLAVLLGARELRAMGGGKPPVLTLQGQLRAVGNEPFVECLFTASDGKEYGLLGESKGVLMKLQGRALRVRGVPATGKSRYAKAFLQLQELTIVYTKKP